MSNHHQHNMQIEIKDGHVYKDGEEIGTLDVSTIRLSRSIGPTVKAAIKRETGDDTIKFEVAEPVAEPETETQGTGETVTVTAPLSDAELLEELRKRGLAPAPAAPTAPREAEPSFNPRILDKQQVIARLSSIEPPPATLPDMGDKTPAFVEWVRVYGTDEEFAVLYPRHRKTPTMAEHDAGEKQRIAKLQRLPSETTDKKGDAE